MWNGVETTLAMPGSISLDVVCWFNADNIGLKHFSLEERLDRSGTWPNLA